jgi:ABC-2 type transport system ATP-binding protein
MLKIDNLSFNYKRNIPVLEGLSLNYEKGTVCGLLGRNGAGKSTLLYLISGLLRPAHGSVNYDGFTPFDRKRAFLEDIFLVPEEFFLPDMHLKAFVEANAPFYPKFSEEDMRKHLDTFEMSADVNLNQLSMGQKKKVIISFALATNTGLLLLDEPTNGLDISAKRSFRNAIASGMTDDRTIVISTHQVHDVDKLLDHVTIMNNNGILLNSSIAEISNRYRFNFTADTERAEKALIALEAPGGYNIVESATEESDETEVNLETLFEFVMSMIH